MIRARFLKPAEGEVEEAVAYFDQQRLGLGDRFEQDLLATINFVVEHPLSGKPLNERVRRFNLRTFRDNVIYVIDELEIVVVAVAHHRRRPGYTAYCSSSPRSSPTHSRSTSPSRCNGNTERCR